MTETYLRLAKVDFVGMCVFCFAAGAATGGAIMGMVWLWSMP